jgi:hypothetical protein
MEKMNTTRQILILISALTLGLSGCLTISNMSKQMTIPNTDCEDMKDITITDEREDLNSTRHWTAECNGRKYQCNSHEDGYSTCYDVTE